jgi:hypothetical protein
MGRSDLTAGLGLVGRRDKIEGAWRPSRVIAASDTSQAHCEGANQRVAHSIPPRQGDSAVELRVTGGLASASPVAGPFASVFQYGTPELVKSHTLNPNPPFAIFPPAMVAPFGRDFTIQGAQGPRNRRGPFFLEPHRSPA